MYRQADWLAGTYGWGLEHIFNFVTVDDVNELMKYAPKRIKNEKNEMYSILLDIVSVGSFHEKGATEQYNSLKRQFEDPESDQSYLNKKLDVAGLEMLKARKAAVDKRRKA